MPNVLSHLLVQLKLIILKSLEINKLYISNRTVNSLQVKTNNSKFSFVHSCLFKIGNNSSSKKGFKENSSFKKIFVFGLLFFLFTIRIHSQNAMVAYSNQVFSICQGTIIDIQFAQGDCPSQDIYSISINGQSGTYQNVTNVTGFITNWDAANRIVTINTSNAVGSIWVGLSSCGCSVQETIVYNVNPAPTVNPLIQSICTGNTFTYTPSDITNGSIPVGTTYTWTVVDNPNVTGESNQASAQSSISQTLTSTSLIAETVTYSVTPTLGACNGQTFNIDITVNPTTSPSFNPIGPYCSGVIISPLPTSSLNGISGTWSPVLNNTATTNYTFTPTSNSAPVCASNLNITLTINPVVTGTDVISSCTPLTWIDGTTYTTSNSSATFTITGGAATGCDSLVTLNFTLLPSSSGVDIQTACDSYTWIDGVTYTNSTSTAIFNIIGGAINGCDSLITLNLIITPSTSSTLTVSQCVNYNWNSNGQNYTVSGIYTNTIGCNTDILDLTILPTSQSSTNLTICSAQLPYQWNGLTFLNSGSQTATLVSLSNGCDSLATLNLTVNQSTSNTTTVVACDTYTWALNNVTYTTSGIYTVVNGCDTETLNLTINNSPTLGGLVVTDVSCNGLTDGSVLFTTLGGTPSYIISPSPTNLSAGTYIFTITDANQCFYNSTVTINEPTVLISQVANTVITYSGGTSTVTIGATGGTPAYVGTGSFNVTAGTYTYTVTDANGCTTDTTLTITEPLPLTVTATGLNAACFGDLVPVSVVGNGGTPPYIGDGTFNVGAGTYTYTITDFYGNTASTSITITQPTALVASCNPVLNALACNYDSTLVTVSAIGGTGILSGIGTFNEGLGIHSYIVTDANGCQVTTSVTITAPPAIVTSVSIQDVYCSGGTGSIDLTISGGVGPYNVIWDGTVFTEDLAAVVAGTYVAEITDANGCLAIQSANVVNDFSNIPIGITNLTGTNTLTCIVTSINLQGYGGSNYIWSNGTNLTGASNSITTPGIYTLSLNDSNGCPKQITISINENIIPPTAVINNLNTPQTTIITCSTPTINLQATGGASYLWSNNLGTNSTQNISTTGSYTVTVIGTNGCTDTETIIITNDITPPIAGIVNNTASNTLNCNYPTISLTSIGGGTYQWSNNMGTIPTINVTTAGSYTVTVTGTNGCTDTETFNINYIPNPSLTVSNMTICSGNSVSLNAIATPLLGGTYYWSGGLGNTSNSSITSPILGTNTIYQVYYEDPNGCTSNTVNVTVTVLQSPTISISGTTTLCSGINGNLTAIPSIPGGTPNWSSNPAGNYPTTLSISVNPITTTTYTVNYLAPNGCYSQNASTTISVIPTPVVIAPSTGICTGGQTTITATPDLLGGSYVWSPLPTGQSNGSSIQVSPVATTNFDVVYTLNGCTSNPVTVQVTVTDVPTVSVADIGICTGATGTIVAVPSSTAGIGTYTWTPSWTGNAVIDDETFLVSPPQTSPIAVVYTLNNCPSLPVTAFVNVTNTPTLSFTGTTLCAGSIGTLTAVPNFSGGTFEWENGETTPSIQITTTVDTIYNVNYNLNGCIITETANVTVEEIPNVTFMTTVTEGCAPLTVNLINTTSSTTNCSWDLGNGASINQCGNLSYTFMEPGCYDISLTTDSPNGCSNTLTLDDIICVYPQPLASFNLTSEVISSDNPILNVTNTSIGAVDYIWNYGNGIIDSSLFQPEEISYTGEIQPQYIITLIAISENGCIDSTYEIIKVLDELLLFAPNTFIPDGDGLNDIWYPVISSGIDEKTYELIIINRWGEIVFQTKELTQGWDGTYKGNKCQDGTYSYNIRFRSIFDKQNQNIMGHINLIR